MEQLIFGGGGSALPAPFSGFGSGARSSLGRYWQGPDYEPRGDRRDLNVAGEVLRPAPANPRIAHALGQISAARTRHALAKPVSIYTRSTQSSMAVAPMPMR